MDVEAELRGDLVSGPMSIERPKELQDGTHRLVARIRRHVHDSQGYGIQALACHRRTRRVQRSPNRLACPPDGPDQRARYCFMRSFFTVLPELM